MKFVRMYIGAVLLSSLMLAVVEYLWPSEFIAIIFMISPALLALIFSSLDRSRPLRELGWKPNFKYWATITVSLATIVSVLFILLFLFGHFEFNDQTAKKFLRISTLVAFITG